uniref:Large ribosomal subunit protein mL37 n=1 Tax=Culicoides sonorensis TaxID=179676 RepID=A0A336KZI8_CULSO
MRITLQLLKQHNQRMFRRHWYVQGKRTPIDLKSEEALMKKGLPIIEANTFINQKLGKLPETEAAASSQLPPDYHETKCAVYGDSSALLLGMPQAQVLLNTLKIEGYPEKIEEQIKNVKIPTSVEKAVYQSVMSACLFDAEQKKLGYKIKDPERPAFNFPRIYGITDERKNRLLFLKFIQNCEKIAPSSVLSNRRITQNTFFKYPFKSEEMQVQLEVHAEVLVTSKKPLLGFNETNRLEGLEMPNIFPASPTVSIVPTNTYTLENIYPIKDTTQFIHPHTIFLHFSPLEVKHLPDIPVTDNQFESRALMKAFAVASSKAQAHLGTSTKDLPQPIVVQTVQCDTKRVQFGIFQLNTLDLNGSSRKNFWYCSNIMNLYEECAYKLGRPVLEGYNRDVLRHMSVFYNNS